MEEKDYQLTAELKKLAYSEAKDLLEKGKDAIREKLPQYLKTSTVYGVEVMKDIFEVYKESIENKKNDQKEFLQNCNKIIDTCNGILLDGDVTEEEKIKLIDTVNHALEVMEESNKQTQKDDLEIIKYNKEIKKHAITVGGALTGMALLGTIAVALVNAFKKH